MARTPGKHPTSLTLTQSKNPHRAVASRHGKLSYLEYSFAKGLMDEVDWWIEQGVVAEALAGKARSRRDYASSLMEYFSIWLGNRGVTSIQEAQRIGGVLDILWQGGAKDKTDRHATWLTRLVSWPLADALLDLGKNPWDLPKPAGVTLPGAQADHSHAVAAGLDFLHRYQQQQRDGYHLTQGNLVQAQVLVARMDRMLGVALPDIGGRRALAKALAGTVRGGVSDDMAQDHPGLADTRLTVPWARWRDQLLDLGAPVLMGNMDALETLIADAPHTAMRSWHINGITSRIAHDRHKAAMEAQGKNWWEVRTPELPAHEVLDLLIKENERRALNWSRATNRWLNALEPAMRAPLTEDDLQNLRYDNASRSGRRWGMLLDAPHGRVLAKRIGSALLARGQPLPWTPTTRQASNFETHLDDLFCVSERRSVRRIAYVVELLSDPAMREGGVSTEWRAAVARQLLTRVPLGDKPDSPAPGFMTGDDIPRQSYFQRSDKLILPTAQELRALLDLADLSLLGGENPSQILDKHDMNWVGWMLGQLPDTWENARVPDEQRDRLLDVLAQRGTLDVMFSILDPLMDGDEARFDDAVKPVGILTGSWWSRWMQNEAHAKRMEDALERANKPDTQQRFRRLVAWTHVLTRSRHPDENDGYFKQTSEQEGRSPYFQDLIAHHVVKSIASHRRGDSWNTLEKDLNGLTWALRLGWSATDALDPTERLVRVCAEQTGLATEAHQALVVEVLRQLGSVDESGALLLTHLMTEERNGYMKSGWSDTADVLIEAGACPSIPGGELRAGSLAAHVASAVARRELGNLGRQVARERCKVEQEEPRRKPRF